jgi:hypothetical protein
VNHSMECSRCCFKEKCVKWAGSMLQNNERLLSSLHMIETYPTRRVQQQGGDGEITIVFGTCKGLRDRICDPEPRATCPWLRCAPGDR